jgi:REP element-mobilizing transposase RayT
MPRRWIAPWKDSEEKPAIYHVFARIVDRRFAFGVEDKEQFRMYMRMMENFSGCRVLSYCLMCNHFHILLEVPPKSNAPLSDAELLKRLSGLYPKAFVAEIAKELAEAREVVKRGLAPAGEAYVHRIHERFTYRMENLSEFMKTLLQRFTRWHNRQHQRRGNLWEETFKSVIVEDGLAARTMAAYIDLNPVRAGMVADPAEYRWSSYGEAMGATGKSGSKAKAGLVRAILAEKGAPADARYWSGSTSKQYRMLLLEEGREQLKEVIHSEGEPATEVVKKGIKREKVAQELAELERSRDVALRKILCWRVRYFTDGAVIGSREFVDRVFRDSRERFGPKRKTGARKLRGAASAAAGMIWSARDLRKVIE